MAMADNLFLCTLCNEPEELYIDMVNHVNSKHKVLDNKIIQSVIGLPKFLCSYQCRLCSQITLDNSEDNTIKHIKEHHAVSLFSMVQGNCIRMCRICLYDGCNTDAQMRVHLRTG